MTKHITLTLVALFITAPAAPAFAQAYDCWPVRCAGSQASTKPGLKKVEDKKKAADKEKTKEEQEAEAQADETSKAAAE